jgi:hypothetical protein
MDQQELSQRAEELAKDKKFAPQGPQAPGTPALSSAEAKQALSTSENPKRFGDLSIAGADTYQREIERRQSFGASVKRGELYADGKGDEIIVQFLRLICEADAQDFQQLHPSYFPPEFWQGSLPSDQDLYRGTVVLGGQRPNQPAPPYWQAYRDVLLAAWACGFADEYVVRLLNVPTHAEDSEDYFKDKAPAIPRARTLEFSPLYRFQRDILTLVRSTWRAKLCDRCHKPFVADKPSRHFCPERYATDPEMSCYKEHRREVKRDLWNMKSRQYRKPAKARMSSSRRARPKR